jgi:hypothetical protein
MDTKDLKALRPTPPKKSGGVRVPKLSKTGVHVTQVYCRFCMENKATSFFYSAVDNFLDKNGYMSICKPCINEIFQGYLKAEGSLQKAIYFTCKTVNVIYNERAIDALKEQLSNDEDAERDNLFGLYKSKFTRASGADGNSDLTFIEPSINILSLNKDEDFAYKEEMESFWGKGLDKNDYKFLENEIASIKKTSRVDSYGEITLAKEICYKQLSIYKDRIVGKPVDNKVKE